jgi:hypothetical protein
MNIGLGMRPLAIGRQNEGWRRTDELNRENYLCKNHTQSLIFLESC